MNPSDLLKKYTEHEMFSGRCIKRFDDPGMDGDTPLHLAAFSGNAEDVEFMVRSVNPVDVRGGIGNTPLHLAILAGHADVAAVLLRNGAQLDAKNDYGDTPVDFVRNNYHEVMSVIEGYKKT
jgi:ankyrin repeat protein